MLNTGKPKIGLLPFYLKLYDDISPELRSDFDDFISGVVTGCQNRGLDVQISSVCRVADEFKKAVSGFEESKVDCIFTLHLAYSPSLESIDAFCDTSLPIVILDVTMDSDFGIQVSPTRIMYNHGVHGVMDFANMLKRRKRPFEIVAGSCDDPATLDRVASYAYAAVAAAAFRSSRVLRVGEAFTGMGDFSVAESILDRELGIKVDQIDLDVLDTAVENISDAAVEEEVAADNERFACEIDTEAHSRSVHVGLGLRSLLDNGGYTACSVNFQEFNRSDRPSDTMPFLEICKAMERGIGYAGEGDVLTAALVGALAQVYGAVTFTEIFCPDWSGDSLFLSHMGEINPALAVDKPRIFKKPFFIDGAQDPAVLTCAVRPGPAVFVNLAPGPDDTFSLIVVPVEVLAEDERLDPAMRDAVRIWIRPQTGIAEFLEAYSRAGGTHHSALVLDDHVAGIAAFGRMCGMEVVQI